MEEQKNEPIKHDENKKNDYLLPLSIVIAALLVAGSWIYTAGLKNAVNSGNEAAQVSQTVGGGGVSIKPVSSSDHIRGNENAPVKIVEFSDLECPFCKMFQETMLRVMDEYGKDGRVAWIYRHFPIDSLHPKARKEAEASECANELGGNDKFWAYVDMVFKITPSNNGLDSALLPKMAADIGLDRAKFESCLNSGKYAGFISGSIREAEAAGAQGTPYSIVISQSGNKYPINGAQPYDQVKLVIDEALR